jgi:hypothetical protein
LWDEKFFSPIARRLGWSWSEWVSSPQVTQYIDNWTLALGIGLLLGALGAVLPSKYTRTSCYLLLLGGGLCLLHALLTTQANFGRVGHFIELSLQWMSPFLLIYLSWSRHRAARFSFFTKLAIALTFIGHGLYAWGFYPVPGDFQQMMLNGFGLNNAQALLFLKLAGFLDFLAAGLLFFPYGKLQKIGLLYIIIWGFLTAAARIWTHLELNSAADIFLYWLPEFGVRTVHFLVPLALYYWVKEKNITLGSAF